MNKKTPAIEIKNIVKDFIIPKHQNNSLKQLVINGFKRNSYVKRRVLDDISFTINKGDFFGIVGRNGSGKSTLLKLICGIYTPTQGEIIKHGKITPFIELGVGFNPELSGRDNVYLNGALLGFDRQDVDEVYDEIVEFAELEEFMDLKLKNYSSGMQVRLAFSIAIKSKSPILIFDEVLAVGDEAFQRKCLDVFEEYKAKSQTVVLVTHDMETVKRFCNKAVMIHDGKIVESGNPMKVADKYSALNDEQIAKEIKKDKAKDQSSKIQATVETIDKKTKTFFEVYEDLYLNINWQPDDRVKTVMVDLFKNNGEHITGFKIFDDEIKKLKLDFSKRSDIRVKIPLALAPGKYVFQIGIRENADDDLWVDYKAASFIIKKPNYILRFAGQAPIDYEWIVD